MSDQATSDRQTDRQTDALNNREPQTKDDLHAHGTDARKTIHTHRERQRQGETNRWTEKEAYEMRGGGSCGNSV